MRVALAGAAAFYVLLAAALLAAPADGRSPTWTLAFATRHGVVERQPDGRSLRLAPETDAYELSWSPDGRYLAYADGEGGVTVVSRDGRLRRRVASEVVDDRFLGPGPHWSPDGRSLAWVEEGVGVTVASVDGLHLRHLLPGFSGGVAWLSPTRLVCACKKSLVAIDADGKHPRTLFTARVEGSVEIPSVSSDGREIAFGRHCYSPHSGDLYCQVALMRPDGTGLRTLLPYVYGDLGGAYQLAWIPGTHRLLAQGVATRLIDADGGRRRLLALPSFLTVTGVGPDGSFVTTKRDLTVLRLPDGTAVASLHLSSVAAFFG